MKPVDEAGRQRIDEALTTWCQGDCVLGEHWFLFRIDVHAPLTEDAAMAAEEGVDAGETQVRGFMVATQTCDIVRSCGDRPYIEVCALVLVETDKLKEIQRGRRPNYAFVPGVADRRLVADLDRVMTVEKALLVYWDRTTGCRNDDEVRRLSLALARKRARFAFPDEFVRFVAKLQRRMSGKHHKDSDEGRALRALREIRVRAVPAWDNEEIDLMFWFIRNEDEPAFGNRGWDHYLDAWLKLIPADSRFKLVGGVVLTLDDLTAGDYVESDPLDLDHLSTYDG